jgi:hypothetical protein
MRDRCPLGKQPQRSTFWSGPAKTNATPSSAEKTIVYASLPLAKDYFGECACGELFNEDKREVATDIGKKMVIICSKCKTMMRPNH